MQYSLALLGLVALATASPVEKRQAVTAIISPDSPPPPGCTGSFQGTFGIAVLNVSTPVAKRQAASESPDGQPVITMAPVSQITDGQIQGGLHTMMMMPVANQIKDGQIQIQTTLAPVTEFSDGQPQAPTVGTPAPAVSEKPEGQPIAPTTTAAPAVSEKPEGQPIAPTSSAAPPVSEKSEGQPIAPTSSAAPPVSEASEGQPQASSAAPPASSASAAPPATGGSTDATAMSVCAGGLSITLENSVLTDSAGRTGYIASNYQFQFDKPPQAGAIYTAGFTDCANGTLALGGSAIFYQCLSGSFYNLYNVHWAAQCSPVYINILKQVACS